jgi:hypothetical protein
MSGRGNGDCSDCLCCSRGPSSRAPIHLTPPRMRTVGEYRSSGVCQGFAEDLEHVCLPFTDCPQQHPLINSQSGDWEGHTAVYRNRGTDVCQHSPRSLRENDAAKDRDVQDENVSSCAVTDDQLHTSWRFESARWRTVG